MKYKQLQAVLVSGLLLLTGCENGNLFGKLADSKDSSDPKVLISQAENLLREGNYGAALSLYEKALSKDSDNAEALYGAAAAAVGSAGLNIAALIANLTRQSGSSVNISSFADLVQQSRIGTSATTAPNPNSILANVDIVALDNVIDTVLCRLQRIVSGASDGSIPPNNIDVLLNFGSLCAIRGILRPIRANLFDITNDAGTYNLVKIDNTVFNNICTTEPELVQQFAGDIVATWHLFNRAVQVLNLGSNQTISKLRDDIANAADLFLNPANTGTVLPSACLTALSNAGITYTTFTNSSATNVFDPPTGC